jgi:hypothetical protein
MTAPREFVGRWSGAVREGSEREHAKFLEGLRTPASAELLVKYSLTEYAVYQRGRELDVIFKADKPTVIPGFLKNKRMWPEFWEFARPGEVDVPADKALVFRWQRA